MPPKGKGKKSKKQLEEEKLIAEAEKKAQEELERKIAAEQEERERIAEMKRKAEEEKRREEEAKRLGEEMPEEMQRAAQMEQNARFSVLERVVDLDAKTLACKSLPDVDRETDLNCFITQWRETEDPDMNAAAQMCQVAENVIRSMQDKLGEAKAMYESSQLEWCNQYIQMLRTIQLEKFNQISAKVFEFMDVHTKLTPEQIAKLQDNANKRSSKGDQTRMETYKTVAHPLKKTISYEFGKKFPENSAPSEDTTGDVLFGIWANVLSRNQYGMNIEFGRYIAQLPQKQASGNIILRALWTSYDYLTPSKIQDDFIVGGIVDFQMYYYPEQSKQAGKWNMRPILTVEQRLRNIPFPDPSAHVAADIGVEIKFGLAENIYMSEDTAEVKIAIWDSRQGAWSHEHTGEVAAFNFASRQIKFTTLKFAPMAMLQSRCTDYPYVSWKLRCVANDVALLDIETKRLNLCFEISARQVKLVNNTEDALKDLADVDGFSPGYLLEELAKCGILLMPRNEDAQLGGIEIKDQAAEERAIVDVSLGVRAFHFQNCKWNQAKEEANPGVPPENIVMRIRENIEFDAKFEEDNEPDWRYIMWWNNKVSFVEGCRNDMERDCRAHIAPGALTHGLLSQACEPPNCSSTAHLMCKDLQYIEFTDTVKKTLRLLRLFSFS